MVYTVGTRQDGYSTHGGSWRQEELTLVMALAVAPSFKQRNKELVSTLSGSPMAQEKGPPLAPSRISLTYSGPGLRPDTYPHIHRLGCMSRDLVQRTILLGYLSS